MGLRRRRRLPVVALISQSGVAPVDMIGGPTIPALDRPTVQVLVRSTAGPNNGLPDPRAARSLAAEVAEVLTTLSPTTSTGSGTVYLRVELSGSPFPIERDAVGRATYAFGAQVWRMPSTGDL